MFLIDENGQKLGVTPTDIAIERAMNLGLDLVEVSPQANPPVAKIIDFGKLLYEQEKQMRKSRSQSKRSGEIKCIRLGAKIGDHDMMVRVNQAKKFFEKGYKVKAELLLRGREKAHPEIGKEVIARFVERLELDVALEQPITREGGKFTALITLKKK